MFPLSKTDKFSGGKFAWGSNFGFWGRAVKAFDNFSRKLAWLCKTILEVFPNEFVSRILQIGDIDKIMT